MAQRKVRLGFVGTGMVANRQMRQARQVPGLEVVAAADINRQVLDEFCERHGIARRYLSYEKMLAEEELDAVTVALPPYLHAPATIAALEAGLHVICEKPMALSSAEARAMVRAAKKAGRVLGVYYRRRFSPGAVAVRRLIERGRLGKVYFVRVTGSRCRGRPYFDMPGFGSWFIKKKLAGGGVVMDLMGYDIDLVFWLLGFPRVKAVCAHCWQEIDRERARAAGLDIEEFAAVTLRLPNNVAVFIERGFAANVEDPNQILIFGSKAGVRMQPLTLYRYVRGELVGREVKPVPTTSFKGGPLGDFVREIRGKGPTRMCTAAQGLFITRVQEAIYESAKQGREIAVNICLR